MNARFLVGLTLILVTISGCVRDEARPVGNILADAQVVYQEADKSNVPGPVMEQLTALESDLSQVLSSGEGGESAGQRLRSLVEVAGFTARPALDELSKQYTSLQADAPEAARKLLVARTYQLLASELESVSFRIS